MVNALAPTKGNLIAAKNTLRLSKQGYEMLDKKRNILIREMMTLIEEAKDVEEKIEIVFGGAYHALESANIMSGMDKVRDFAHTTVLDESVTINLRSVMGVELPMVSADNKPIEPSYSLCSTNSAFDETLVKFNEVKQLTLKLAEIENSVYRLAVAIKKTQKRANALQNITIPIYTKIAADIQNALEEKDREEHTRLKMIKER